MDLPKKYLSYSALSLWKRSKPEFRKRYYENQKMPDTPEITFGRKIGKMLEIGEFGEYRDVLSQVPRYETPEYELKTMVGDVPFLGYADSFDPTGFKLLEYKTGRDHANGKPRWTQLDVEKTDQLPIYSLLTKLKHGGVDNHIELWWMRTKFLREEVEFDGHTLAASSRELTLDGHVEGFKRIIFEWERKKMFEEINIIAKEIENDYRSYKRVFQEIGTKAEANVERPLSEDASIVGVKP